MVWSGMSICDNGHLCEADCFDYCKPIGEPMTDTQAGLLPDDGHKEWLAAKAENNWTMPDFPRWQTLPVIRFWCGLFYAIRLEWWDSHWATMGRASSGHDWWVVWGLKKGWR